MSDKTTVPLQYIAHSLAFPPEAVFSQEKGVGFCLSDKTAIRSAILSQAKRVPSGGGISK